MFSFLVCYLVCFLLLDFWGVGFDLFAGIGGMVGGVGLVAMLWWVPGCTGCF